ncbi:prephenate dehydratase domain-containing protein [uncultured Methanoregula sp.]|uniref:prephenate dehydratase n=1 Tax=uncultured Methanoregula sp. TaxID=1005933 RepID=UPI002AAB5B00|nr:prephenate dehydratase domain-containing protein [uncultured Methanoregula sp.]
MNLITLGPEGTFSHELALKIAGKTKETILLVPTIHGIMSAVARGGGDGIVPMENSEAGSVGETLDGLTRFPLSITAEMYMPIHHNLASADPLSKIRVIYAHPQTNEQCSECIEKWGIPVIHTSSNAISAIEAKKTPHAGAILSETAASIYGMPVIVRNTQNNAENITRFVRISTEPVRDSNPEKCSILIDPRTDRAGLLHDLLHAFAERKINLTRIESRPSKRGIGNYVFFLDYAWSEETADALDELRKITTIKELGCYSRVEVAP